MQTKFSVLGSLRAIACIMWFTCNTQVQACVFAQACTFACGEQSSHMHTGVCAPVHQWLLFRHVQAGAWLLSGIACMPCPSAESAPGPGGAGWPGNLSQLLCPVSGKPPAGVLPTEPACPCTCALSFPEGPRKPSPRPRMPESTTPTHTMQGVCNPLPPTSSEALAVRTRREPSRAESASGVQA